MKVTLTQALSTMHSKTFKLPYGNTTLLQRGPKFAVTTPKVPLTEYIAVTEQICDRLGENTEGVNCSEYYQKTKDLLQDKCATHPNITKQVNKCMVLLQDTNIYQPCRDLTGQIHRQVQASLHRLKGKHGKDHQWVQLHYNQLLPMGRSSPPATFYGLPQIHKANCPMHPIVSACGTYTYNLTKYLTRILKVYVGHTSSFVKDSKYLMDKLQSIELQDNEELVAFDVSALFTSIPVIQALDIIKELIILHQTDKEFKSKVGVSWQK